MIKKLFSILGLFGILTVGQANAGSVTCQGKFINPITDICWSCMFPMQIGGAIKLNMNGQEDNKSTPNDIFCACTDPVRAGITLSFWEPTHLVEVVRSPFCMVSLGGIKLAGGSDGNPSNAGGGGLTSLFGGSHKKGTGDEGDGQRSFWQVHWYKNPVVFWLEAVLDNDCLEKGALDIGWLTELDPTWKFPEISFLQAPDSALFANPISQAACAADCVKANAGFPFSQLFWCAGCSGSMYPLTGWVSSQVSPVQASKLMVARMQSKMHRDLVAWRASGEDAICGYKLNPVMDKQNYKMAMTYPVPARKYNGLCCEPFGRTTLVRDVGKTFPYKGSDFAYQLFRKRDCCGAYSFD